MRGQCTALSLRMSCPCRQPPSPKDIARGYSACMTYLVHFIVIVYDTIILVDGIWALSLEVSPTRLAMPPNKDLENLCDHSFFDTYRWILDT